MCQQAHHALLTHSEICQILPYRGRQKKTLEVTSALPHAEPKAIRLKPSTTDYATFVRTTSKVLGTTGPASRKTKPSTLVLSVANAES